MGDTDNILGRRATHSTVGVRKVPRCACTLWCATLAKRLAKAAFIIITTASPAFQLTSAATNGRGHDARVVHATDIIDARDVESRCDGCSFERRPWWWRSPNIDAIDEWCREFQHHIIPAFFANAAPRGDGHDSNVIGRHGYADAFVI